MNYEWDKTYTVNSGREFFDFGYRHGQTVRAKRGAINGTGVVEGIPPVDCSFTERYMRNHPRPTISVKVTWEDGWEHSHDFDPITKFEEARRLDDLDCPDRPRLLD